VSQGWMNSPTHKANILSPNYKEIGISMASGMYQNANTIFVVQMFGTPITKQTLAVSQISKPKTETYVKNIKVEDAVIVPVPDASLLMSAEDQVSDVRGESTSSVPSEEYSSGVERTIFNTSKYASIALTVLFIIVFVATCVMIFIEIEKQHPRHIIYAVSTLVILTISIYIIKNVFELKFILI
jgi:hypothetical protein